jgi:hypothetical protein
MYGKNQPDATRSNANEQLETAGLAVYRSWRFFALAGAPRIAKSERETQLNNALVEFDKARYHYARCLYFFAWLCERRDERQDQSDKAAVTRLEAPLQETGRDLCQLLQLLRRFRRDLGRSNSLEYKNSSQFTLWSPKDFHLCSWCQREEEQYRQHIPLSADGFMVRRQDGKRFCCSSCFYAGRDLEEPAPKPAPAVAKADAAHPPDCICPIHKPRQQAV